MQRTEKFNLTVKAQRIELLQERIRLMYDFLALEQRTLELYEASGKEWDDSDCKALHKIRQEEEVITLRLSHNSINSNNLVDDLFLPDSENGGLD